MQVDSPNNKGGYQGIGGEEVHTERRFNSVTSNIYQNHGSGQKSLTSIPLKGIENLPNEMLETSNRPLNVMSAHDNLGVLDDYGIEESKNDLRDSPAAYVSSNQKTSTLTEIRIGRKY